VVRRILVSTVGVEAAVLGGYGVVLAVDSVTQQATERGAGVALAASAVLLCGALVLAARAAWRARRAARAPIVVWQILQAAVAKEALAAASTAGVATGVLLLLLAVVALVAALWPGVLHD
jgi:hypothetical protein